MGKCSITIFNLTLIIFFSQFVFAQADSDESRQNTFSALNDARIEDEKKVNKTVDKPEVSTGSNSYFYQTEVHKSNHWGRTNNINSQLKIPNKIDFFFPDGELKNKESAVAEPVEIVDFKPPGEFNLLSVEDTNKTFFYKAEYSPAAKKLKPSMFNFNQNGERNKSEIEDNPNDKNSSLMKEKFHWKAAITQSLIFLGIQHSFRMMQPKTTRYLGGPFFADWKNSLKNLRGWDDGNKFFTNYIAHPMQGGLTGKIFINNSDRAKKQEIGKSKPYWESRLKAMAWSAVWSTQFELGPISEASIGNVGLNQNSGRSTLSWSDLIVTPILGTVWLIGEDAIDKYILKNWLERKAGYKVTTKIKILRSLLTPTTSFSNLLRGKAPWKRDNRLK